MRTSSRPMTPIPLERSADVLERVGRLKEAAQNYLTVAEIYLTKRDVEKAIGNWERAARPHPGLLEVHSRLALAYERTGRRKSAVREYLAIAAVFQRRGETPKAIQACQRALRLDRNNPQVLNSLQALQAGFGVVEIKPEEEAPKARPAEVERVPEPKERARASVEAKGPIGEAQLAALSELATYLFESGVAVQPSGKAATRAMDFQRTGDLGAAIEAYQEAKKARLRHPALHLNLGSLLVEYGSYSDGVHELQEALKHPRLAAGAHFAIGQAYMAMEDQRRAAEHLLYALRAIALDVASNGDTPSDSIYDNLIRQASEIEPAQLGALNQSLIAFMTGTGWRRNVADTLDQLEDTARLDGEAGLLEMIATDGTGRIAAIMSRIDQYRRNGLITLAMDEAHYALEIAPTYLPAHVRIAEVLLSENRMRPAIEKYNMVAETYRVRGDGKKASRILSELLQIAPMDISVRRKLVSWLEEEDRWSEVLQEYIKLADAYYQLADWDGAREAYEQAQAITERTGASRDQVVHIMHRIGDIDVQRLDLRQALRTYERIRQMVPEDERARLTLVDLHYRLGNSADAIAELDDLLRLYARSRRVDMIAKVLEDQITLHPNEMALRSRLARVYQQQRRYKAAVIQLDALGELQLEAGLREDALVTIRTILSLNPPEPDRESYRQLLRQLGG
ncbi:MAG: tetratricopeptide repeat protein [Anaerolineae bacterium]|nr:tetratricopeptide repeat protein [Anaerolineae bacterium]